MYKLLTSGRGSDELSIEFDRDRRQREMTFNENQKETYHVRLKLKDVFGFAEHEGKDTYGLGYIHIIKK